MSAATRTSDRPDSAGPASSAEHAIFLGILRLAARLVGEADDLLRGYELSGPQFNVLRVLQGDRGDGLPCGEVADRLITRDPDITRMLDRLEQRGLVTRARDGADRRVVLTRITDEGRALVARIDAPMLELHRRQFAGLDPRELAQLLELLQRAAAR